MFSPSRGFADIYYLTKKGRNSLRLPSAPARSIYLIEHDKIVAQVLLSLKASGLLENYWTERELRIDTAMAHSVIGTGNLYKFPDLIVDMKAQSGSLRIAIEVERSQKTAFRYDQISLAYLYANRIGLLIFACANKANANAVERGFGGEAFKKAAKIPVIFLLKDFAETRMEAEALFMGRRMGLKKLILAALQRSETDWISPPDKNRTVVRRLSGECKEVG